MKKLLSIFVLISMLISMFTICAFAGEEAPDTAEKSHATTTATVINPIVDIYKVTKAPKRDGIVSPGEYGDKIETVRGVGYRMVDEA